jgi:CDP-2,3-bis-(O-geranylgeranyl)-sn-glycerol synthase
MSNFWGNFWLALWFFLPAGAANVAPILVARLPGLRQWNAPIDGGQTYRGKRIFGSHKTWRGLIAGIVGATFVLWLQQLMVGHSDWAHQIAGAVDYAHLPTLIVGPLFAIGALGGDAIESFLKRQRGIEPGKGWFPFDQTDYIIGGALLTAPFVHLTLWHYTLLLFIWFGTHVAASYIGYLVGLKERPI